MNKILSVFKTNKKKIGIITVCIAVILTAGTAAFFALNYDGGEITEPKEISEYSEKITEDIEWSLLSASFSIDIPNIDMSKIHNTTPLNDEQKQLLLEHGYTNDEILNMDVGDFNEIEKTWILSEEIVEMARALYPFLEEIDITKWTYGNFEEYYTEENNKLYAPSENQIAEFQERNITLPDARYLLKDFHSYDNILAQRDDVLKDIIEKYYLFKIEYVEKLYLNNRTD